MLAVRAAAGAIIRGGGACGHAGLGIEQKCTRGSDPVARFETTYDGVLIAAARAELDLDGFVQVAARLSIHEHSAASVDDCPLRHCRNPAALSQRFTHGGSYQRLQAKALPYSRRQN